MRRIVLGLALALGLALGTTAANAAPPPGRGGGPACADIIALGGSFFQPTETTKAAVAPTIGLAADSCRAFTYTVYVLDEAGTQLLAQRAVRGNGEDTIEFESMFVDKGTEAVCVYATSGVGNRVFDRAPADGCVLVTSAEDPTDFGWWP